MPGFCIDRKRMFFYNEKNRPPPDKRGGERKNTRTERKDYGKKTKKGWYRHGCIGSAAAVCNVSDDRYRRCGHEIPARKDERC